MATKLSRVGSGGIKTGAIGSAEIADGAIQAADLGFTPGGGSSGAQIVSALPTPASSLRGMRYMLQGTSGTQEVVTITVTAPCSTNGNVTVTLDGVAYNIALTTSDNTTIAVAAKLRNGAYNGWTASGTGSTVTLTATTKGDRVTSIYAAGTTGATATLATTVQGIAPRPDQEYVCALMADGRYGIVPVRWSTFNVRDFGAVGDANTDDSAAFAACGRAIYDAVSKMPYVEAGGDGNFKTLYIFYIPAGNYKITQPEALMAAYMGSHGYRVMGLTLKGDGRYSTFIQFSPTKADSYLLRNANCFSAMTFEDIAFVGTTNNANFMESYSNGGAQNIAFNRCAWGGTWKYGIVLIGVNNNSEFSAFHCNVNGFWDKFFYVPEDAASRYGVEPQNADQFVNYNFYACNMEIGAGSMIYMAYGGSVSIWGGSYMYYAGTTQGGTMFNFLNQTHFGGACRLLIAGIRVELPTTVCKLLYCEWAWGTVTLINVDQSVQQWNITDTNRIDLTSTVKFNWSNDSGPAIQFIGCMIQGRHEYQFQINPVYRAARVTYQNCDIWHYAEPHEFIVFNETPGFPGARPLIKFDQCRGAFTTDQSKYVFDTTLGWDTARTGLAEKRVLKLSNYVNGGLPGTGLTLDAYLPMNAVITRVLFYMPQGVNTSAETGWTFTLANSAVTPVALATASPVNGVPSNGFNVSSDMYYTCDSDERRHLVLTSTASGDPIGACLVEYIA